MDVFAEKVVAQPEEDYWLLAFADKEYDTESYLMLQRAFHFTQDDVAQGMATYYLEVDDQACSLYGGLRRAALHPDHIDLEFDEEGSEAVGIDEPMTIRFDPASVEWGALSDIARKVLGDLLTVHPPG